MIEIHCNPARVEKVLFLAASELEEDFDLAAWLAIRPLVSQIDRRLRAMAEPSPASASQRSQTPA